MDNEPVTVQAVSWRDLCPLLIMFRSLPMALSLTILVLALAGIVLTPIGWIIAETVFVSDEMRLEASFEQVTEMNRSPYRAVYPVAPVDNGVLANFWNQLRGVELVFSQFGRTIYESISLNPGLGRFLYFLVGGVWSLFIWSFFGCAICRIALMRFTRDEPIGLDDAVDYAVNKFLSCFAGVTIPILAVLALAVPTSVLGLLMATNLGAVLGGLIWFAVLAIALLITFILFGLAFSWPLIISAISCEGQDSFDGMSRAFAYLFQRPLHYLCYVVIAIVFSGICWLVVSGIVETAVNTSFWATSWGSNVVSYRTDDLRGEPIGGAAEEDIFDAGQSAAGSDSPDSTPGTLWFGQRLIEFWNGVARTVGAAFLYGLFWCLASAIYLLLRKDLDDTEMDEIYLVDERRTFELPPLADEEQGVPQLDDDSATLDAAGLKESEPKSDPPDSD